MEPERVDKVSRGWIPKAERSQPKKDDHRAEAQSGEDDETRVVLKVPYVKGPSERLKRELKRAANVDVVFGGGLSIRQLLCKKLKPAQDPLDKQGTVYVIPCKDCQAPYIGETIQPLGSRVKQHMASTKKGEMDNGPAHHTFSRDHRVDFDGAVILDVEKKKWLRKTKEALYIRAANPGKEITHLMNQDRGLNISPSWSWTTPYIKKEVDRVLQRGRESKTPVSSTYKADALLLERFVVVIDIVAVVVVVVVVI